ncbi:MAG: DNA-binding protein [Rubritepida sp.]|nr:DNA-binding protein [Rubritepida sp.]
MLSDTKFSLRMQNQAGVSNKNSAPVASPSESSLNNRSATSADATVGERIKKFRRAAGHTQKQVADLVGVTGAQFHRYETGTTRVAASRLMAIAKALGIRPEQLIGTVAEAAPPPALLDSTSTDALVELVEVYSSVDARRRSALLAFARAVAGLPQEHPQEAAAAE